MIAKNLYQSAEKPGNLRFCRSVWSFVLVVQSFGSAYKALSRFFTEFAYAATNFGMRIRL